MKFTVGEIDEPFFFLNDEAPKDRVLKMHDDATPQKGLQHKMLPKIPT